MAIASSDLIWRLSTKSGAAGNTTAQTDTSLSLGKYVSTTNAPTGLNAVFDQITAARNQASEVDYRCLFVLNNHATLTLYGAKVWLNGGDPAGGMVWTIAVDSTAASAKGSATAQALQITNDTTAPSPALTFSAPTSAAGGITLGDLGPGQVRAVWIRCAATNSQATTETVTVTVTGDTLG